MIHPSSSDDEKSRGSKRPPGMQPSLINSLTRQRISGDLDQVGVGPKVNFSEVGGLEEHVRSLKEMVILPLLYPEMYERFQITPPRGVLFHGPPGCGKTLLARALVTECSTETRKVSFFIRKGADCLSKWVGEAEKQLKLLFDEAKRVQPSIIFFDEIDGLAPVRSAKQEQIYSSIVSTLLALMDGLDSRGQVVIIGATNRIDAVDPALRRPGRFDREFFFPLPNEVARRKIVDIHTKGWQPPLSDAFKNELSVATKGYCGADIKGLCTEAALKAIQRMYPQVYDSADKLIVDPASIQISLVDFQSAFASVVPASRRSSTVASNPLTPILQAPLQRHLDQLVDRVSELISLRPEHVKATPSLPTPASTSLVLHVPSVGITAGNSFLYEGVQPPGLRQSLFNAGKSFTSHTPRLLICGEKVDAGKGPTYLGAALLHEYDGVYVQSFELATLLADSLRTPEANCIAFFSELKTRSPAIAFVPEIDLWSGANLDEGFWKTFRSVLLSLPPDLPLLLLATTSLPFEKLSREVQALFTMHNPVSDDYFPLPLPTLGDRANFFGDVFDSVKDLPPGTELRADGLVYPEKVAAPAKLELAPPPAPKILTPEDEKALQEEEEVFLREIRNDFRLILDELIRSRKYIDFREPVDAGDVPDYYSVVHDPVDLSAMRNNVDRGKYLCAKDFKADIKKIVENAELFNKNNHTIVQKAYSLFDVAYSMLDKIIEPDVGQTCNAIAKRRAQGE